MYVAETSDTLPRWREPQVDFTAHRLRSQLFRNRSKAVISEADSSPLFSLKSML